MEINFKVSSSGKTLWTVLSKTRYDEDDCFQPIIELLDNSFASKATIIRLDIDIEKGRSSIEDNGVGLPIDSNGLNRCFTYGSKEPTDLNEHGCGLKTSLAILDPNDETWSIAWKRSNNIYQLKAPYSCETHIAMPIKTWVGKMTDCSGTYINFPISKDNFSSLYSKTNAKKHADDIIKRVEQELAHRWMRYPKFMSGAIQLFLNDKEVKPYSIPRSWDDVEEPIIKDSKLSSGAIITLEMYHLKRDLPGSTWFKKNMSSNGFYLYKNGRMIQKINSGSLYKRFSGAVPDNHHNGFITIVNVTGNQLACPVTVPTKNKFIGDGMFEEMADFVNKHVSGKINKKDPILSEESLMVSFRDMRNLNFQDESTYNFNLKESRHFEGNNMSTPQIDGIEEFEGKINVFEAKRDSILALQTVLQIFGNYILFCKQSEKDIRTKIPIVLLQADSIKLDSKIIGTIEALAEASKFGFPLEIWNYKSKKLYINKKV
jgi:hypothetical protein